MQNKNFIDFAVTLLIKDKADYLFSFFIFSFIIFILSATLFISDAIQFDITQSIKDQPEIVVENTRAGREFHMHEGHIYDISKIAGVSSVEGYVEGYYYFGQKRLWFHLVSDDTLKTNEMVVGQGVKVAMEEFYYKDKFNFLTEERIIAVDITKIAPKSTNIISNDVIYLHPQTLRRILGLEEEEYSKLYVGIPNKNEVGQIGLKIAELYPSTKVMSKEDTIADYRHLFYYKGGLFLILYVVVMVSFLILLKNQISLVYGEKKKEIAILRSIGFCIKDIIALKCMQNFVVAISAYLLGIALAYVYVFGLNAPLLRNIFLGTNLTNNISFTPIIDFNVLFLIFIAGVVPFMAFVIIPAWKIAIGDISEAVK